MIESEDDLILLLLLLNLSAPEVKEKGWHMPALFLSFTDATKGWN
jgi:hypothetical protein